ncbi:MAG: indole-3-glycerol phosphate synthase TrpC [Actinobacteria bacterium]|mgnify:CR=1 FL=1|uniref:Indole-3-glycerol phosphate synthase n=1 Tax=Microcella pacifica TaxID=2591847 RepID=A0A9E5JM07_9MICO|nr:indole-3-glycerol phosphate synthase TrpC [Microcella pacifica]MBU1249569.1 indole-3-glycerol phosphate synthase TrpC [Actinomycetota bacterium]MBU1609694.1 indole-3-glycerol phosphate synthase TrpC [Actinomycetota bacterium]MBU2316199.1 indole-3-glycerol phosphate synthase TrpC [Actinomycetota bacterium]MBU2385675.1 indole-3-glycerol phosphate synthase TrpC [Actinomycetota bacterium]NHF61950.1 indole-3-glycerol phosphate synthase TrpC [Microcella pacifica]
MLDGLVAGARDDAARRRQSRSLSDVEAAAVAAPPALDACAALQRGERIKVIAEVKRASPSRGALAEIPDPADLARSYAAGGAAAVSVLTEERRFGGSLDDLSAVRAAVDIPVLRKDFIAEPYQVLEARAAGADLVLLIVAALDDATLARLHALVLELGMTPLVETHDAEEVRRAVALGASVIGVNARDLSTFELDRDLFGRLAPSIPDGTVRIAESAVSGVADVEHYRRAGADVVLVGEALVTGGDPVATLHEFLAVT